MKAQVGATIVHRVLSSLFRQRGVNVDRTYQLNTGGNTDFMNMLDRQRLGSKKKSKTEAVQAMLAERLADENIHVGPSDYVPWQKDNKLCFLRHGRQSVRRRADEPRTAPVGRGQPEFGGGGDRCDPLLQARAGARRGRRADRPVGASSASTRPSSSTTMSPRR